MKILLILLLFSVNALAKNVTSILLSEKILKSIEENTVTVNDALESTKKDKASISYVGYSLITTLDFIFGGRNKWSGYKNIEFKCADGYKAKIPTDKILKHSAFLVYKKTGNKNFSIINNTQGGKKVALGPYYVVWADKNMQENINARFWPYQVVEIILSE